MKRILCVMLAIILVGASLPKQEARAATTTTENVKLSFISRMNELQTYLDNRELGQYGALYNMMLITEFSLYVYAIATESRIGFTPAEVENYGGTLNELWNQFNQSYLTVNSLAAPMIYSSGGELTETIEENVLYRTPEYYGAIFNALDEEDKDIALTYSGYLVAIYQGLQIYELVPDEIERRASIYDYKFSMTDGTISITSVVTSMQTSYSDWIDRAAEFEREGINLDVSLDVDIETNILENLSSASYSEEGLYLPADVELSTAYTAYLAAGSILVPFKSYIGSEEYIDALLSLTSDSDTASNLLQLYDMLKGLRKPLYFRQIDSEGQPTGAAELITVNEFIDVIESGEHGVLVPIAGQFGFDSESQEWVYNQDTAFSAVYGNYTYDRAMTIEDAASAIDTTAFDEMIAEVGYCTIEDIYSGFQEMDDEDELIQEATNLVSLRFASTMDAMAEEGLEADYIPIDSGDEIVMLMQEEPSTFVEYLQSKFDPAKQKAITYLEGILAENSLTWEDLGITDLDVLFEAGWEDVKLAMTDAVTFLQGKVVEVADAATDAWDSLSGKASDFISGIGTFASVSLCVVGIGVLVVFGASIALGATVTAGAVLIAGGAAVGTAIGATSLIRDTMEELQAYEGTRDEIQSCLENGEALPRGDFNFSTEATVVTPDSEEIRVDAGDLLFATDTITDELDMGDPVLWFGTQYRRSIDNLTSVVLTNCIQNTSGIKSLADGKSDYLYINVFGDIVTEDNLVIMPGIANPVIYGGGLYQPYTAAFINAYPSIMTNSSQFKVGSAKDIGKYLIMVNTRTDELEGASFYAYKITTNNSIDTVSGLNVLAMENLFSVGTTGTTILEPIRTVFGRQSDWQESALYEYSPLAKVTNAAIDLISIFPYDAGTDTDGLVASAIVKNAFNFLSVDSTTLRVANQKRLNDGYVVENIIIPALEGTTNAAGYGRSQALVYEQFVEDTQDRIENALVSLSDEFLEGFGLLDGVIGVTNSYEDFILGNVLQFIKDTALVWAMVLALVLLFAFVRMKKGLFEIVVLLSASLGVGYLFVWIIPPYLSYAFNSVINNVGEGATYEALAMQYERNRDDVYTVNQYGSFVINTSSITLYKVGVQQLDDFYTELGVNASDMVGGGTFIINQASGLYAEGDSIKVNTDILFRNLDITGEYAVSGDNLQYTLRADKLQSDNLDYYVPYYQIVDAFIEKLNDLASVYSIPRNVIVYPDGEVRDSFMVYSYVNSSVFVTPGSDYTTEEPVETVYTEEEYAAIREQDAMLSLRLQEVFGDNTDFLGIGDIFMNLTNEQRNTQWAQIMQRNGYYEEDWSPVVEEMEDLITYVNRTVRSFIYENEELITGVSDDCLIKIISLKTLTALTQRTSDWDSRWYPFSLNYEDLTLEDLTVGVYTDDFVDYTESGMTAAAYIADQYGWFNVIVYDLLVLAMFIASVVMRGLISISYLMLGVLTVITIIRAGDIKRTFRGYVRSNLLVFVVFTLFNVATVVVAGLNIGVFGIYALLAIDIGVLWLLWQIVSAILHSITDLGGGVYDVQIQKIKEKFQINTTEFRMTPNRRTKKRESTLSVYRNDSDIDEIYRW